MKGKLSAEESKHARSQINTTKTLAGFENCDFIIEAVSENPSLKRELFLNLDQVAKTDCILASNTSSISITVLLFSVLF